MAKVINFGSLNIDKVYQLPHIVRPGETISSTDYHIWCGGKGGNQSIALARAGAVVFHAGCVGNDGAMLIDNLRENGVNTDFIKISDKPSGHAIIQVDEEGENSIILYPGANCTVTLEQVDSVIASTEPGDFLLLQNEINLNELIIEKAYTAGMIICMNFAPFDQATAEKLPLQYVKILMVNEQEGADLSGVVGPEAIISKLLTKYPEMIVVITLGSKGAICGAGKSRFSATSPVVDAVDTTCAGDTFIGYFMEAYMNDRLLDSCLQSGCSAAAIAVCRPGASSSIPFRNEVKTLS
ncbi:MAG: ribokinase [Victivallaceae bacterium]|nr:ribokinase [Victivallaceae bacterium]